jgi:hypothetical protein
MDGLGRDSRISRALYDSFQSKVGQDPFIIGGNGTTYARLKGNGEVYDIDIPYPLDKNTIIGVLDLMSEQFDENGALVKDEQTIKALVYVPPGEKKPVIWSTSSEFIENEKMHGAGNGLVYLDNISFKEFSTRLLKDSVNPIASLSFIPGDNAYIADRLKQLGLSSNVLPNVRGTSKVGNDIHFVYDVTSLKSNKAIAAGEVVDKLKGKIVTVAGDGLAKYTDLGIIPSNDLDLLTMDSDLPIERLWVNHQLVLKDILPILAGRGLSKEWAQKHLTILSNEEAVGRHLLSK